MLERRATPSAATTAKSTKQKYPSKTKSKINAYRVDIYNEGGVLNSTAM